MKEYDSKVVIRKVNDDQYEVIWNVNNSILAVLDKKDMHLMIDCLKTMTQSEPSYTKYYHFPVMRHRVTG